MRDDRRARHPDGRRCRPCATANLVAGLFVAGVPVVAAAAGGDPLGLVLAISWAVLAAGFTIRRVVTRGYLPGADLIAHALRIDRVIGPGPSPRSHVD